MAVTAIALLALAVLVMHGASATAEHIPEGEAAGVRHPYLDRASTTTPSPT